MNYQFFIVNKSGLLIYERNFVGGVQLSSNDMIRFSSTLHSMHAISNQISPTGVPKSGIKCLYAKHFKLYLYQTRIGTKFVLIAAPGNQDLEILCKKVYQTYSDYVLKNPFYETDQQIKIEGFDIAIERILLG